MAPTGRHRRLAEHAFSPHDAVMGAAARHLARRRFLTVTAAAAALAFSTNIPARGAVAAPERTARITKDPFTLGVASGDPLPDSVLLWTRLAPEPFLEDGGMGTERVTVEWEVAVDEYFAAVLFRGTADAHAEYNHSVHVDVKGLTPGTVYYYRFRTGAWISPTGRTRTAPPADDETASLKLGAVACQAYQDGYYTVLRHLAQDDVDVVFHLGDYLYEYAVNSAGGERRYTDIVLPDVFNRETMTLADYRLRYSLYKSDEDLKAAHAAHPFVVAWDDHETENNYADDIPENAVPPEEFLLRRAAAYRAYWENQPLRAAQLPQGPDARLYRRLHWGTLAQFDILDTRQYRSDQAYDDRPHPPGPESDDPARTMTGAAQEQWLLDGWLSSTALWNVMPQQVCFSQRKFDVTADAPLSMDAWDGYRASRARVVAGAQATGVENWLILTGDVHVGYALDVKEDFDDPESATVGTEVTCTSVASGRDGVEQPANWDLYMRANPHMKFYNGKRGYVRVGLDREAARLDFRTVSAVTTPGAPVTTVASFVTEAGNPGLTPA
ncbi:alkaline phosphatase D family protein [Streptomyces mutabilis]|uniref:alkaline phosphatase D family protein n=1 Tax=Streptomyces TaxID=1883 RepID=UPI000BCFD10B|nr:MULTISPECIES: alkaline phosphatase D family protein [unclassified Streptomyces]MDN3243973.1 alkaline phosphatase D family protein [Streptomyces sp. ZSW22]MDN3255868.1 alkaline phosphatase D family protein [Streptomyces sp. MA25(2023)]PAK26093.1 alkaline phosphatase [Streptomyces sp. alain-838]